MRKFVLLTLLSMGWLAVNAQEKGIINSKDIENKTATLRMIYPQWQ